jgi:hypothetical protein
MPPEQGLFRRCRYWSVSQAKSELIRTRLNLRAASSFSSAPLLNYGSPVITSARSVTVHLLRTTTHPAPEVLGSSADVPQRLAKLLPIKMLNLAPLVVLDLLPIICNTLMLFAPLMRPVTLVLPLVELTPARSTKTPTHQHNRPFQPMVATTLVPLVPASTHTGMTILPDPPPTTSWSLDRQPFLYTLLNPKMIDIYPRCSKFGFCA